MCAATAPRPTATRILSEMIQTSRPPHPTLQEEESAAAHRLWVQLDRVHHALREFARARVERHGLGASEYAVLEALLNRGSLTLSELAASIGLTSGSTTYVVDKLEERGLLERRRCRDDRRVRHTELTDAGRALVAELCPQYTRELRAAMQGLTARDKETMMRLLHRLEEGIPPAG